MQTVPAGAIIEQLNWRYAVKKFDAGKKIPEGTWKALEQAAQLAPSSFGLSLWKFVVISDNAPLRAKLREAAWNQPQITDASHLMVFCRQTTASPKEADAFIARVAEVRGIPASSMDGYKNMIAGYLTNPPPGFDAAGWMSRQVYIALGFFLSAAAMMGVDACPMEGFSSEKFDEILGLKGTGYTSVVAATAGYRAADDPVAGMKKVRWPESRVLERK